MAISAVAQGTAFTYQGFLRASNTPANGTYDLKFSLFNYENGGWAVAEPVTNRDVVVTNGHFMAVVDFGAGVFNGETRWLEVGVATNGVDNFTTLTTRQLLTPTPYAITAGNLYGTLSANQIAGTLSMSQLPTNVVTLSATGLNIPAGTITAGQLAARSVSLTNLALDSSLPAVCAGIEAYGVGRYGWPRTLQKLSTNGLFVLAVVGNGWAEDSEYSGFVTNLLTYKPLAGYASDLLMVGALSYGSSSGQDTALMVSGDDTNWHGSYAVLTNTGSITAHDVNIISDVCGVHYLANPDGGSFAVDIRTNGASPDSFTNLDNTWTTVAGANAYSPIWAGRTLWWTNATPCQIQLRVRATSPGRTPVVGQAQWDSRVTNGVILCQYSHQASDKFWNYTDPVKVFPIWRAWRPDLVLFTGGFDDSDYTDLVTVMTLLKSGFPDSDVVSVGAHLCKVSYNCSLERQYCYANGIPFFDGQAASAAAWGSFANGVAQGVYADISHLTPLGYATFSKLLWSWMNLTGVLPASQMAGKSGITTNIVVMTGSGTSATLCFTNGLLQNVQ